MDRVTIPCVCFVPRGAAAKKPKLYEPTAQEIDEDIDIVKAEQTRQALLSVGEQAAEKAKAFANELGPEFDMDNYDNDEDFEGHQFFSALEADAPLAENDPNLRNEEDSEDEQENEVRDTDLLLVAGSAERDWSTLEVYLWDESEGAFFVHHEVQTGAYPLALEWLNTCKSNETGVSRNLMAVGSFDSAIEIWDLDVLETPEPIQTLGVSQETQKLLKSKNAKKKQQAKEAMAAATGGTHTSAILSLHRNPLHANVLASGSADTTVRVWDVQQGVCQQAYTHHKDKVQAVRWAPAAFSAAVLASGSYDKKACVFDVRAPEVVKSFKLTADCEAISWNPHFPSNLVVASEDGKVQCLDVRMTADQIGELTPLWTLKNGTSCSSIAPCAVPNMWVTGSMDGNCRVYHAPNATTSPVKILEKDLKIGPIFNVKACEDEAATFGFGGNQVAMIDLVGIEEVVRHLGGLDAFGEETAARMRAAQGRAEAAKRRMAAKKAHRQKKIGAAMEDGASDDGMDDNE